MIEHADYAVAVDPDASNNPHSAAIRMVGAGKKVLEVGCWSGHVTQHLASRANDVVGVEIDPDAAQLARTHAVRVHVADLDTTPLSELEHDQFDVIMLCDVLEHLKRPQAVLADALGLLADGGRVVISVPNVAHIDVRVMLMRGDWEYQADGVLDDTHLRWFTKASLREMLADAGLVAVELERVRVPYGGSNHLHDPESVPAALVEYLSADPEAETWQYVVAAERSGTDVLRAIESRDRPVLEVIDHAEMAALLDERDALRNEVDAWRRSRVVRWSQPLRGGVRRVRGWLPGGQATNGSPVSDPTTR
jgi:2-polyprenyl-3-methyl-5-hydroxy-6-metoxy-1,4-benzoquinol methylase